MDIKRRLDEEKFTGLEEARKDEMEVEKEEDEAKEESSQESKINKKGSMG